MSSSTTPEAGQSVVGTRGTGLVAALLFIALVVAALASLGAPLITAVAQTYGVSLFAAQWTLTGAMLTGAVATPVLARLGSGRHRRKVVLTTLAVVTAGSVASVIPAPFAVLLCSRIVLGVAGGLVTLMMATAREHLGERAPSTIAMLSVASTVGIGVGYPIAGLLAQVGGVRVAFLLGVVVAATALVIAIIVLPRDDPGTSSEQKMDWLGATLLSFGLVAVLFVTTQLGLWVSDPLLPGLILVGGVAILAVWVAVERRVPRPLIDLTALRHPAVAGANLVMGVSGISMYLLFSLIVRYMQTPPQVGYGYGLTDVEAGLVLVPFSVLGFVAGRLVPALRRRVRPFVLLMVSGVVIIAASALFAGARTSSVAWPIVTMGALGFAVGGFSAVMPQAILAVTPAEETAAAMGVNGVVRAVGFAIGSALSGLLLAAYTAPGHFVPAESGYTVAALTAAALAVASIATAAIIDSIRQRQARLTPQ